MSVGDFTGRRYQLAGHWDEAGPRTIRFADADCGCATTTYSYKLTTAERAMMARRIAAALNLTTNLTVEHLERMNPLPAPPGTKEPK